MGPARGLFHVYCSPDIPTQSGRRRAEAPPGRAGPPKSGRGRHPSAVILYGIFHRVGRVVGGAAAELAVPVTERASINFQLGFLSEHERFLGSRTEGAFEIGGGVPTYFGGVSGEVALSDSWKLVGSTYAGLSYPQAAAGSLLAEISPILTQSFSLGVVGDDVVRDGDRFGLVVNQPLRVARGSADLVLATGRDRSGKVLSERFTADLAPDGREIDLEAFYDLALGERSRLTASALLRSQPGHLEQASPEGIFMLRFNYHF